MKSVHKRDIYLKILIFKLLQIFDRLLQTKRVRKYMYLDYLQVVNRFTHWKDEKAKK